MTVDAASKTALICQVGFDAWGIPYRKGDEVKMEDASRWPEGTLQRRMDNGFVAFGRLKMEEASKPETVDISKMDKSELIDYALGAFNLEIDSAMDIDVIRLAVAEAQKNR